MENLEPLCFIGGTELILKFEVESNTKILIWKLFKSNDLHNYIMKKHINVFVDNSYGELFLHRNDTVKISGEYLQKVEVTLSSGEKIIKKGMVSIIPNLGY